MGDMELMTVKETAAWLQMHPLSIYRLVKEGKIPFVKLGTRIRIRRDKLEESLEKATGRG